MCEWVTRRRADYLQAIILCVCCISNAGFMFCSHSHWLCLVDHAGPMRTNYEKNTGGGIQPEMLLQNVQLTRGGSGQGL